MAQSKFVAPVFKLGTYKHYKGDIYEAVMIAMDEATLTWSVVYEPLYDHPGMPDRWIRSIDNFLETIEIEGKPVKRFTLLDSN